jgi:hypothetical protein
MKKAVHLSAIGLALTLMASGLIPFSALTPSVVAAAPAMAFVSGTVKDESGLPLAGALVAILEARIGGREVTRIKTDLFGKFKVSIPPGTYHLRAEAAGFRATFTRINLDAAEKLTFNFSLKRADTLVEKRGDRDDYRWIGRSVPRSVLHIQDPDEVVAQTTTEAEKVEDRFTEARPSFHGMVQLLALSAAGRGAQAGASAFGANFAISGSLGGNFEMALIGQGAVGNSLPQRLTAVATLRPHTNHQITASVGYGQMALIKPFGNGLEGGLESELRLADGAASAINPGPKAVAQAGNTNAPALNQLSPAVCCRPSSVAPGNANAPALNQLSLSAIDSWQVFQPLLIIYGFDYSRFVGSAAGQRESLLPRLAIQFTPSARTRINAAVRPGASEAPKTIEGFSSENINASFEMQPAEVAFNDAPILDRSQRFEIGVERVFNDGVASLEATAFYDVVSGHGVGVLALPLEASSETQATFQQVARQVAAMNGAARGVRVMYAHRLNDYAAASVGYSFGQGERFNDAPIGSLTPARLFTRGFFQVATVKLDLDFTPKTGTRISTVLRLSPSAVVFAIDPFAGRMSVYDPNINIYLTQELPSFGLPLNWQMIVDIRNLLNQLNGVEDGTAQLVVARSRRMVRGGIAFRW